MKRNLAARLPDEPRILIVEDDRSLLGWLVELLGRERYRVTGAASFEAGKRALAASPDLLITDVRLGAFNGLQLIFRARAKNPRLPVIVMTGFTDAALRAESERLHAVHLEKPFDSNQILTLVASLLVPRGESLHPDR